VKSWLSGSAVGLVALAAVVAALVAFAIRTPAAPDETVDSGAGREPTVTASSTSSASSTEPVPSPSPSLSETTEASSEPVLLSVTTTARSAVRALAGDCDSGGAVLELSDDGGTTWREVDVPARSLLRVKAVSTTEAWVVGTDTSCRPRFIRTTDGGRTWVTKVSTAGAWHLLPTTSRRLHAPEGNVESPCKAATPATDLAVSNNTDAAILCRGGQVHTTRDAGATWAPVASTTGATALAFPGRQVGFAATPGGAGCDGTLVLRTTDAGTTWQDRGCAEGTDGAVTLAFFTTTAGLMATMDEVWQTDDAGRTWTSL
jgi:photosystem II stability/assembly factor-like uncharacterized protein